jgi:hypothetical protein
VDHFNGGGSRCPAYGQRCRTLNVVDDCSRDCPAVEVDSSLPGIGVTRVLDRLAETRGLPQENVLDNGPVMTDQVLDIWAEMMPNEGTNCEVGDIGGP